MMNAKLSRKFLKFFEKFHHILFIRSKMAVFSLSIIGICQVAFIRKNAFDLLIVLFVLASLPQILFSMLLSLSAGNLRYGIPGIVPAAGPSVFWLPSVPDNALSEKDSPAWHPLLPQAGNTYG